MEVQNKKKINNIELISMKTGRLPNRNLKKSLVFKKGYRGERDLGVNSNTFFFIESKFPVSEKNE